MAEKPENHEIPADDMTIKKQYNAYADEMNKVQIRAGRPALTCGAKKSEKRGGGFCKSYAGSGTQHVGYGRCKYCGGNNKGRGKNKSNGRDKDGESVGKKLGLYSGALSPEETAIYEQQMEEKRLDLEHEIYMLKAKIVTYLSKWQRKYKNFFEQKKAEKWLTLECPGCGEQYGRSSLDTSTVGRRACHNNECYKVSHVGGYPKLTVIEELPLNPSDAECDEYAEYRSRIYYSDSLDGARSFYTAGDITDRSLDKALQTLARLARNHSLLNIQTSDNMLDAVNAELKAASKGKVDLSWTSKPQHILPEGGAYNDENTEAEE